MTTKAEAVAADLHCGNLFATRDSISTAMEYVDSIANTLTGADKVAVLTAVAVLCNTVAAQLRQP